MENYEESIQMYKAQLDLIKTQLESNNGQNEELLELKKNLEQLIELTTQSLIEQKKSELLKEVESLGGEGDVITEDSDSCNNQEETDYLNEKKTDNKNDDFAAEIKNIIGTKCRAPFKSSSNFHNAVIYGYEESSLANAVNLDDIFIQIVFSMPTETKMVPCPFYLQGSCKFSGEKCKFSHGNLVKLSQIKEYQEPDYTKIKEGARVIAKSPNDDIWSHGIIDMVSKNQTVIKFGGGSIETVSFEHILPLAESGDEEIESENEIIASSSVDINSASNSGGAGLTDDEIRMIDPTSEKLGGWEIYTRGIGSKLMEKMGYIFGTGLGKAKEGRIEPVPTIIYPTGKSLDYCVEKRLEIKDMERVSQIESEKHTAKYLRQKKREEQNKAKEESMFNFLNAACTSRSSNQSTDNPMSIRKNSNKPNSNSNSDSSMKSSDVETQQVKSFKLSQSIDKIKGDITRLEESAKRHKGRDEKMWNILQSKLRIKKTELQKLQQDSSSCEREKARVRDRQKLTVF